MHGVVAPAIVIAPHACHEGRFVLGAAICHIPKIDFRQ